MLINFRDLFNLSESDVFAVRHYPTNEQKKNKKLPIHVKVGISTCALCYQPLLKNRYNDLTGELHCRRKSGLNYHMKLWNQARTEQLVYDPWKADVERVQGKNFSWHHTSQDGVIRWEQVQTMVASKDGINFAPALPPLPGLSAQALKHKSPVKSTKHLMQFLLSSKQDGAFQDAVKKMKEEQHQSEEEQKYAMDEEDGSSQASPFKHQNLTGSYQQQLFLTPPNQSRNANNDNSSSNISGLSSKES